MRTVPYDQLDNAQKKLLAEAEKVMQTAYNPYSNFYVGAALLTPDNHIILGSNVENAAYGSTICAERAAIVRTNAAGYRIFNKLAIISRGRDFDTEDVSAPCGACRQVLYEFRQIAEKDLEIILSTTRKNKIIITTIDELLPLAFGPKDMNINVKKYQKVL